MVALYCCTVFLLAGFVQGLTSFGAGLVAIPLLTLVIDIKLAVGLCILLGMIINTTLAVRLRSHLDRKKILPLFTGSLPGVLLGSICFKHVDPALLKHFLGAVLVSYSLYSLAFRPKPLGLSNRWGYVAGFCTGAIASVISAGGPPSIIYATLTGWTKEDMKATLTGFFLINGLYMILVYSIGGLFPPETLRHFLPAAPFVLLGSLLGSRFSGRIRQSTYLRIVYIVLALMGLVMFRRA